MKSSIIASGMLALTLSGVAIASATPTTTVDGRPLATPTPQGTATPRPSATPRPTGYTYSAPFNVTVEHATGTTLTSVVGQINSQLNRILRSRCPKRSTLVAQSFQMSGGVVGTPSTTSNRPPSLDGNAQLTVVCRTRN